MVKCDNCKKRLLLRKKFYDYHGKQRGSFELTDEKVYCKKCYDKLSPQRDPKRCELLLKIADRNYKEALSELEKHFDKNKQDYWYNKGNILRNLKKDNEALSCYNEAIFIDTHYVKAWYRKGQILYENNEFKDAGNCFENVLELEKSRLNKDSLIVKPTQKGVVYASSVWTFGALLMRALSYMGEKKFDDADAVFTRFYRTIGPFPPFDSIESDKFIQYCVKNAGQILDRLEPNVFAEFLVLGRKH